MKRYEINIYRTIFFVHNFLQSFTKGKYIVRLTIKYNDY